jgi:hypothetical protein
MLIPLSSRRAAMRAVRRLHRWSRASGWLPFGTTSISRWLPLPFWRRRPPFTPARLARIEVIGPSVHASSSRELATRTALSIAPERSNLDTLVVVG